MWNLLFVLHLRLAQYCVYATGSNQAADRHVLQKHRWSFESRGSDASCVWMQMGSDWTLQGCFDENATCKDPLPPREQSEAVQPRLVAGAAGIASRAGKHSANNLRHMVAGKLPSCLLAAAPRSCAGRAGVEARLGGDGRGKLSERGRIRECAIFSRTTLFLLTSWRNYCCELGIEITETAALFGIHPELCRPCSSCKFTRTSFSVDTAPQRVQPM